MTNQTIARTELRAAWPSLPKKASPLGLIPAAFLVHNAEEALTIPAMLPSVKATFGSRFGWQVMLPSPNQYYILLLLLTLAVFLFWLAAMRWEILCYGLVVFQATMAINVLNHVGGAILLEGYAPGVVTAVAVELVVTVRVFRHLKRADWLSRRQWLLLAPLALLLHGPIFYGGLMLLARL